MTSHDAWLNWMTKALLTVKVTLAAAAAAAAAVTSEAAVRAAEAAEADRLTAHPAVMTSRSCTRTA